jgi:glycosyltransferase involved in cell wall biosynthesis
VHAHGTVPVVTVQLPIFNELAVAERLIDAVAAIRWPATLEIQVLDDSDDETATLRSQGGRAAARGHRRGPRAAGTRRASRPARSEAGLEIAQGELICIFDADFLPDPDVLERASRPSPTSASPWCSCAGATSTVAQRAHRSPGSSPRRPLRIEHGARHRAGRFFNFSGTAGCGARRPSSMPAAGRTTP